ncbi:undecaprenyl-diphosphate phosphatase [bacterium]
MNIFETILLSIIQGLTEFLPISSSAHLLIVPWIFKFPKHDINLDIALHIGTTIAILFYFRRDFTILLISFFKGIALKKPFYNIHAKTAWLVFFATIPAALAGFFFDDFIEEHLRHPLIIASFLILISLLLVYSDKIGKKILSIDNLTFKSAISIGLFQMIALIPGTSRSGITISAALLFGFKRGASARFSFYLAAPIILGAGILHSFDIFKTGISSNNNHLALGIFVSMITGFLAIHFLLHYIKNHSFKIFAWYRIILGLLIFVLYFLRY